MTIPEYISSINIEYKSGRATEHSYRGYLQQLVKAICPEVSVTNEPTREKCGAPDYIITKKDIPIGYIEAKDIGVDVFNKVHKEQFERYRKALNNLIITDYTTFWLYRDGELVNQVKIADNHGKEIKPLKENYIEFTNTIKEFCSHHSQTIKNPKKLAEMMAGKARLFSRVIESSLLQDAEDKLNDDTPLQAQLRAFKDVLIHDITPKEFSDIYAQTVAYGMFAARLHDPTLPTFSRQEAAELIPKTNPFLRRLFQYIAGYDLDVRLIWIVDGLAEIFRATDVASILKTFGKSTQANDPIIHFYETFLSEYDPELRKARGVWYTPEPVVKFIVRAMDDVLKTDFKLKSGLADTSKTTIKTKVYSKATSDRRSKVKEDFLEQEVHKVQILDPATGTGTFLAEVVKKIYSGFQSQLGAWPNYVDNHLIPRLNGFELLMASYAMAHLKLDLLLTETGYRQKEEQRFKIYLTNSLEEHHPDTGTLFANWLSSEANEANRIKRDTPVMCVLGNPPYSGISSNNGKWITELINDYKYIDGEHFNEKKHWLNDDYVKFIRFGEHFIEKNGIGVLAYINPHGFLENPTFRGMRWHLLQTFDKIYTIDLHGNSTKKETAPDGSLDQNVFDIMQGVSINVLVKTGEKKKGTLGRIFHADLYGKRESKYQFLENNSLSDIKFEELKPTKPNLFFIPTDTTQESDYLKGFDLGELFNVQSMGITSARDGFVVDLNRESLTKRIQDFCDKTLSTEEFQRRYNLKENYQWKVAEQRKLVPKFSSEFITTVSYRPFDNRLIYYQENLVFRSRRQVMHNLMHSDNYALNLVKIGRSEEAQNYFITNHITDKSIISSLDNANTFPLYIYPEVTKQKSITAQERSPNLDKGITKKFCEGLKLSFSAEKTDNNENHISPIDILDYIYAVLYSPVYRAKYKELLKVNYPRIPYPKNKKAFWQFVSLGSRLRSIHVLSDTVVMTPATSYPMTGSNRIEKIKFEKERVYINDEQFFEKIPKEIWEFSIGGYQPAQKWLKDRKEMLLSFEDILHYQKIITVLIATDQLMSEIGNLPL